MAHQIANYLYSRLPEVYRVRDEEVAYNLRTFLEVVGGDINLPTNTSKTGMEFTRDEIFGILNLLDIKLIPDEYLPIFGEMFGFPNTNFGLPLKEYRKFLGNIVLIYRNKSTTDVLEFTGKLLTGTSVEVIPKSTKTFLFGDREEFVIKFFLPAGTEIGLSLEIIKAVMEYLRPVNCWFHYSVTYAFYENYGLDRVLEDEYALNRYRYTPLLDNYDISSSFLKFTDKSTPLFYPNEPRNFILFNGEEIRITETWIDDIISGFTGVMYELGKNQIIKSIITVTDSIVGASENIGLYQIIKVVGTIKDYISSTPPSTYGGLPFFDVWYYLYDIGKPSIESDALSSSGGSVIRNEIGLTQVINSVITKTEELVSSSIYLVEKRVGELGEWIEIYQGDSPYVDNAVESGVTYYYRVRKYENGSFSEYSNIADVTIVANETIFYEVGKSQQISAVVNKAEEFSSTTTYFLERREGEFGEWVLVYTGPSPYVDVDTISGVTYYYRVRKYENGSYGNYSNIADVDFIVG